MKAKVLLTGGSGYIGSHSAVSLIEAGYEVVVIDNLVNSSKESLDAVKQITGQSVKFYEGDVRDESLLDKIFNENKIDVVIHFAGLKAVGESCSIPLQYYDNNLNATINLLKQMLKHEVYKLVFSSSATVYDESNEPKRVEGMLLGCTNPYGWTKYMGEQIIRDTAKASGKLDAICLRYFNPVGAHPSGLIGENPRGIPNNLMPYVQQVASGKRDHLSVYGNDYDTPDGTGIRDYIHVCDLADAHQKACDYLLEHHCVMELNIGTGKGASVLEIVDAFQKANNINIKYEITDRRPGDIAACWADCSKANEILGWKASRDVVDMCKDAYNFQMKIEGKN